MTSHFPPPTMRGMSMRRKRVEVKESLLRQFLNLPEYTWCLNVVMSVEKDTPALVNIGQTMLLKEESRE